MRTQKQILKNLRYIASSQISATGETAADAAREIERLQAELKTLRDWRTPPYSPAQLEQFEESCIKPPSQFIWWRHLPEVPEIPQGMACIEVIACGYAKDDPEKRERVGTAVFYGNGWYEGWHGMKIIVRCFAYIPTQAPPKPEGQLETLEFGETES